MPKVLRVVPLAIHFSALLALRAPFSAVGFLTTRKVAKGEKSAREEPLSY
jgi:hypothetical protein